MAAYWRRRPEWGFHTNVARGGDIVFAPVPPAAVALAERLAVSLSIDHAGFDIAMLGDHPYVLEFNLLFGNRGLGECGVDLGGEITRYLSSMTPKNRPTRPRRRAA